MTTVATAAPERAKRSPRWLLAPLLAFALFALLAGLLARATEPAGAYATWYDLFFSDTIHMKSWLASAAAVLALVQITTAAWIYRKLPWAKRPWVNPLHRWSGRIAFVLVLPVAYHCIFKLGWEGGNARVLAHSLAGSAFFGAFAAKVTIVRLKRFPTLVLPIAGGLLFAVLIALWYSSALWFFRLVGLGV
jgi:hypothetical protein